MLVEGVLEEEVLPLPVVVLPPPARGLRWQRGTHHLDDKLARLFWFRQSTQRIERQLKRLTHRRGRLTELPGRRIQMLIANRIRNVDRRHVPSRQLLRIEPR